MATTVQRVDVWEMRCRFNRSGYWQLAEAGSLTKVVDRSNRSRNGPPGTVQQQLYYRHPTTQVNLARVSQFVNPNGTLGASGKPDPKELVIGNVEYHLIAGLPLYKDPALWVPEGPLRALYMLWRRVKCLVFGR